MLIIILLPLIDILYLNIFFVITYLSVCVGTSMCIVGTSSVHQYVNASAYARALRLNILSANMFTLLIMAALYNGIKGCKIHHLDQEKKNQTDKVSVIVN